MAGEHRAQVERVTAGYRFVCSCGRSGRDRARPSRAQQDGVDHQARELGYVKLTRTPDGQLVTTRMPPARPGGAVEAIGPAPSAAVDQALTDPPRPARRKTPSGAGQPIRGTQLALPCVCQHCGGPVQQPPTGRRRRWCSEACQARGRRRERVGLPASTPVIEHHGGRTPLVVLVDRRSGPSQAGG